MIKRFIQVIDNFYPSADRVREMALTMPYTEPEDFVGWRTKAYQPRGIKALIERRFRLRIKYWEEDLTAIEVCNGVFFSAFSKGSHSERVGIHYDTPATWVMLLIYLTPNAPYETGTSLWQHNRTRLTSKPSKKDAERLGISVQQLEDMIKEDSRKLSRWKEVDRVGNVYNRAVLFPSGLLHSATQHFGSNRFNGRLYHCFHFPVELT